MEDGASVAGRRAALEAALRRSPYHSRLSGEFEKMIEVAEANAQWRGALDTLAAGTGDQRDAKRIVRLFLEWVNYASDGFLRSVGHER